MLLPLLARRFVRCGLFIAAMSLMPSSIHAQTDFLCGGDVSEIPQVEAEGGHYQYRGVTKDPFAIMREAGWNFVRFRIWNQPADGYCDEQHTLALAQRAKAQGLKISLDFHYSDWWADPGKQYVPAKWKGLSVDDTAKALYDFTKKVVRDMIAQGTPPYMVQVGNEITSGMCWPQGRLHGENPAGWASLAKLLTAGMDAVRDGAGRHRVLTMIHLDRGGDNKGATWWFDHLAPYHVKFDTIGLSYYPWWHGHLEAMQENVDDLAKKYGKDVYVVETAYPWTVPVDARQHGALFDGRQKLEPGYPATQEGQAEFLRKVKQIVRAIPGGRGKGLLYWAPTWIPTPNNLNSYGNLATFDYDGNALPAVDALSAKE